MRRMGQARAFEPEKLGVAALVSADVERREVLAALAEEFGPADLASDELPFDFTDYYAAEMGAGIRRLFCSVLTPVAPDHLAELKVRANALEARFAHAGRRKVNLDPGLLCLSRFVLASTKPGAHRIPLDRGIYAELTLVYERGDFRPLPWTYPDYRSAGYLAVLREIRELYRRQRGSALRPAASTGRPPR